MGDRLATDVVLGVDIGTTSTKAVAFTADGVARGDGQHGYRLESARPGYAEHDPAAVRTAVLAAIRDAVAETGREGHRVVALSFSSAMHSLLGLDPAGVPMTPVLTWADARASEQAERLRAGPQGLALHQRTGTPVHPMAPVVKLRWFAERQPELAGRVAHWVGIKEYVLAPLVGELVVDHGLASGTGMFDLRGERWDADALAYAEVSAGQLPRPVPTVTSMPLRAEAAGQLGLPDGTPVVIGGADGPLANLGVGAIRPGSVACSIGTSAAVRAVADAPTVDARGRAFCYVLAPARYVVGGAVNNGGIVLDWLADAVAPDLAAHAARAGRSVAATLLELAADSPPGSGGLLFLPYLTGERAPHWSALPRGVYLGLTRDHRREHLVRAAVEGVCLQLAVVLGSLEEAGVEVREIRATGGFARSALWRRILASAFARPVGFAASPEGSSLGAALLGMAALGLLDSLDRAADIVTVASTEHPDRVEAEVYARLLPIFDAAYDALVPAFADLRALADALPGGN